MRIRFTSVYLFYTETNFKKKLCGIGKNDGIYLYPWLSYNTFGDPIPIPQCAMVSIPPNIVFQYFAGNHKTTLQLYERYKTYTHHLIEFPNQSSYVVWINDTEVNVNILPFHTKIHSADQFFMSCYGNILPLKSIFTHTKEIAYYKTNNIYYGHNYSPSLDEDESIYKKWFTTMYTYYQQKMMSLKLNAKINTRYTESNHNNRVVSCLLLKLFAQKHHYIYIGSTIKTIFFADEIEHFLCTVANNITWYPLIVGQTHKVLLIDTQDWLCKDTVKVNIKSKLKSIKELSSSSYIPPMIRFKSMFSEPTEQDDVRTIDYPVCRSRYIDEMDDYFWSYTPLMCI